MLIDIIPDWWHVGQQEHLNEPTILYYQGHPSMRTNFLSKRQKRSDAAFLHLMLAHKAIATLKIKGILEIPINKESILIDKSIIVRIVWYLL